MSFTTTVSKVKMTASQLPRPYSRMQRPEHREKEMKVLCFGLSRTGTMSLYAALGKLGYSCYHMTECGLDNANDSMVLWHQAIDAKFHGKGTKFVGADFDQMLWRYDAVTDTPCVLFVDELLAAYPDAKVVITSRPVDRWMRSVEHSFYAALNWKRWALLELIDREYSYHYFAILKESLASWTGTTWQDKERLPAGFAAHYEHLRAVTKAHGRETLEFDFKDGWAPLCDFLGRVAPKDEPYPHANEGDWVVTLHYFLFWIRLVQTAAKGLMWAAPFAAAGVAWWYYRM